MTTNSAPLKLKEKIAICPGYGALHTAVQSFKCARWKSMGCPTPPPHGIKQQVLRKIASKYHITTLAETGTNLGDMVYALKKHFAFIYSIELSTALYQQAVHRFAKYKHIQIIQGDSAHELPKLISSLDSATLFWLDGHYSGGRTAQGDEITPIQRELEAISQMTAPYVVAIDDARLFTGEGGYPSLPELENIFRRNSKKDPITEIISDVIIMVPKTENEIS